MSERGTERRAKSEEERGECSIRDKPVATTLKILVRPL